MGRPGTPDTSGVDTQAVVIDGFDGVASLRVTAVPVRDPGPTEVRVRVTAAGVGPWDVLTTDGAFAELLGESGHATFPMVLGWDFAGVVEAAGDRSRLEQGQRVAGMTRQPVDGIGCQAGLVTLDDERCVPLPEGVADTDAASLPCCGLTAWQAVAAARLDPGMSLLVVGATGQLGGFATQLAADRGVRVIASVSAPEAAAARALGAAATVDRAEDLVEQVHALVPGGVDAAFDPVGVDTAAAIRDGGRLVRSVTWGPAVAERDIATETLFVDDDRDALGRLVAMLADGTLHARVGEVFALGDARRAYGSLGHGTGKVVLDPSR